MGCKFSSEREAAPPAQHFTDLRKVESRDDKPASRAPSPVAPPPAKQDDASHAAAASAVAPPAAPSGKYKCGGPSVAGGEVFECFKEGLLFRIVDGQNWYFYNDTSDYEMHVTWKFGPDSKVTAGPDVKQTFEDGTNWFVMNLVIYPSETKQLMSGTYNGYKSSLSAKPLSQEYKDRIAAEASLVVQKEIDAVRAAARGATDPERVLEACIQQGISYVDLAFPPTAACLARPDEGGRDMTAAFKRPTQYLSPELRSQIQVIKSVAADDVDQGSLGDCWFLCSVASLTEMPGKVSDMFHHPVSKAKAAIEQRHGAYRVTINKHGWWFTYILDDYFPCVGSAPLFAKCTEDPSELWVSLIEKAYAKAHGSYASITGGDALHALQDLTGYPTCRFDTEWTEAVAAADKKDELFADLVRYDESGYFINLNTPGVDSSAYMGHHGVGNSEEFENTYKRIGLGMGHAYSVLKVKNVQGYRLLQIRNPWGSGVEWTGDWGDDSPLWAANPAVARACAFQKASDGTFWMALDDVMKYFDGGGVCFAKLNWFDYRVAGAFEGGFPNVALEVRVTRRCQAFFILSQKDRRGLPSDDPDSKYAAIMLSYCVPSEGTKCKVTLNSTTDADKPSTKYTFSFARDMSLLVQLEPRAEPYYIVPRVYEPGTNKSFVLGIISELAVGQGIEVNMKKLPSTARIFQNFQTFDTSDATSVKCAYQFNPETGCPVTREGTSLST